MTTVLPGQLSLLDDLPAPDAPQAPQNAPMAGGSIIDPSEPQNAPTGLYDGSTAIVGHAPTWRAYSGDTDPATARALFRARYGRDPETICAGLGGLLLAGPVPMAGSGEVRA